MPSTPTTSNRFNKQGTGDNTGAWGVILNGQDFDLIDTSLDGVSILAVSGAITPVAATYLPDEVRARVLKFSGSGGSVTLPGVSKNYLIHNTCTGAVTVKTASAAGASLAPGTVTPIYCDGVDVVQATNLWPLLDGTALAPAAYFVNDTNTGFYRAGSDRLGIAAGGSEILEVSTNGAVITGSATVSFGAIINDGTAAIPAVRFSGDTNTGIYRIGADSLGVSVGGVNKLTVDATGIVVPAQVRAATVVLNGGSVGVPALSISGDPDTGLYWAGANRLGVSAGGVEMLEVNATGIAVSGNVLASTVTLNDGAAATPSCTFASDLSTGIYKSSPGTVGVSASGVSRLVVGVSGITVNGSVIASSAALTGALTASGATIAGALSATSAGITGPLAVTGAVTAASAALSGALSASGATFAGSLTTSGPIAASTTTLNSALSVSVLNSHGGTSAEAYFIAGNGVKSVRMGQRGQAELAYGALSVGAGYLYADSNDLVVMSDSAAGRIIFAAGGNVETGRNTSVGGITNWRFGPSTYSFASTVAGVSIAYAGDGTQYGIALLPQTDSTVAIAFHNNVSTIIGTISQTASVTSYNTTSDYRLKDDIADLTGSGSFIDGLRPRKWNWKNTGEPGAGFIAHEAADVSPSSVFGDKDAVNGDGNPIYQGMQPGSSEIIANLVAEVKALRARVAVLETA